jgi:hypothetical protein
LGSGAVTLGTAGAATPITAGSGTASFGLVIHGAASAASALKGLYLPSKKTHRVVKEEIVMISMKILHLHLKK